MLSGIGPRQRAREGGIPVRVDRRASARICRIATRLRSSTRCFDRGTRSKARRSRGRPAVPRVGTTSGRASTRPTARSCRVIARSSPARPCPTCSATPCSADFRGYVPGYSTTAGENAQRAHVGRPQGPHEQHGRRGHAGSARSARHAVHQLPLLRGRQRRGGDDLAPSSTGVELVRRLDRGAEGTRRRRRRRSCPAGRCRPTRQLATFVRNQAWGHHASCTCAIGPRTDGGVLSSDFKVHGVRGLRVVDASVFPRIPGPSSSARCYMIGEKAADVIAADANGIRRPRPRRHDPVAGLVEVSPCNCHRHPLLRAVAAVLALTGCHTSAPAPPIQFAPPGTDVARLRSDFALTEPSAPR